MKTHIIRSIRFIVFFLFPFGFLSIVDWPVTLFSNFFSSYGLLYFILFFVWAISLYTTKEKIENGQFSPFLFALNGFGFLVVLYCFFRIIPYLTPHVNEFFVIVFAFLFIDAIFFVYKEWAYVTHEQSWNLFIQKPEIWQKMVYAKYSHYAVLFGILIFLFIVFTIFVFKDVMWVSSLDDISYTGTLLRFISIFFLIFLYSYSLELFISEKYQKRLHLSASITQKLFGGFVLIIAFITIDAFLFTSLMILFGLFVNFLKYDYNASSRILKNECFFLLRYKIFLDQEKAIYLYEGEKWRHREFFFEEIKSLTQLFTNELRIRNYTFEDSIPQDELREMVYNIYIKCRFYRDSHDYYLPIVNDLIDALWHHYESLHIEELAIDTEIKNHI